MALHEDTIQAIAQIRASVPKGHKIVFISGIFTIIHPGHARLFRYAAEQGDYVVVGVFSDAIQKGTILPEGERVHAMEGMGWVDHAFILRDLPIKFIEELRPDLVVKGREYQNQANPESSVLKTYGGKLLFSSGEMLFSSLDLIDKELRKIDFRAIDKQELFLQRHGITTNNLMETLSTFKDLKVVVIGDTIIDEYVSCDAVGLSQEDPTIVVRPVARESFVGGAGIVSGHARGMGAQVHFFTVVGKDESGAMAIKYLQDFGVKVHAIEDETRPTTLKRRYRSSEKTLLRVNEFSQQSIDKETRSRIIDSISTELEDADVLFFSDFNYGVLPQDLVDKLIEIAQIKSVLLVADSQSSSQTGDIARFKNVKLISPTEHEARISTRDAESGLVVLAEKPRKSSNAEYVVITLGVEGLLINTMGDEKNGNWITDRLPAMNSSPKDAAGAGDAFMVLSALSLASGRSIWESAYLGSLAAAYQVGRVGNIPLDQGELALEIQA